MRSLSTVQHFPAYGAGVRFLLVALLILLVVPGWTGAVRLPLIAPNAGMSIRPFVPEGGWTARIGALRPIGAVTLSSGDPAFGSWSAMAIRGGMVTLLGDGGNFVRFGLRRGKAERVATGFLRDGPGTGWEKRDRDSESLTLDPATGSAWVGYERTNAIWRYADGFVRAEAWQQPAAMRRWPENGGAEALVRLTDGRFLALAERPRTAPRPLLLFAGDPTDPRARPRRLAYRPPAGYDPSDAVQLPGGDLLILNRRLRFPLRFSAKLVRVPLAALRGRVVTGREIATLAPPLLDENAEGLAVTVERGRTMLWIATDNDSSWPRRSYLYKFALAG